VNTCLGPQKQFLGAEIARGTNTVLIAAVVTQLGVVVIAGIFIT
jgi:hypothetical protein